MTGKSRLLDVVPCGRGSAEAALGEDSCQCRAGLPTRGEQDGASVGLVHGLALTGGGNRRVAPFSQHGVDPPGNGGRRVHEGDPPWRQTLQSRQ